MDYITEVIRSRDLLRKADEMEFLATTAYNEHYEESYDALFTSYMVMWATQYDRFLKLPRWWWK